MTRWLPGVLCALITISGWHYLFYSRAAHRLDGIEQESANLGRIRLRRINGFVMLLLGFLMFAGFYTVDQTRPTAFVIVWFSVFLLLMLIVILAVLDVRMTLRLGNRRPPQPPSTP